MEKMIATVTTAATKKRPDRPEALVLSIVRSIVRSSSRSEKNQ